MNPLNNPAYDERHGYYGSRALLQTPKELAEWLQPFIPVGLEFDTLVGTGLSGTIAIVKLATVWHVHTAFIRKPSESNHSTRIIEGSIGNKWLFIDDIVSTGGTLNRCATMVTQIAPATRCVGGLLYGDTYIPAQFIDTTRMALYGAKV